MVWCFMGVRCPSLASLLRHSKRNNGFVNGLVSTWPKSSTDHFLLERMASQASNAYPAQLGARIIALPKLSAICCKGSRSGTPWKVIEQNSKISWKMSWKISCVFFLHHVFCHGDRTQFSQSTSCGSDRIFKWFGFWWLLVNIVIYCYIYMIYVICYCILYISS